jgi:transketolase
VANTIKGKGVSFMENNPEWHGVAPKPDQVAAAVAELEAQAKNL